MIQHPESLYRAVQRGEDVKSFLLALHRRNTGPLRLEQNTEGIKMSEEQDIADMPTQYMPAIPKRLPTTEKIAACVIVPLGMYIDQEGRMCLKLRDVSTHTMDLADMAVERFCKLTGFYPDEILACPSRYVLLRNDHYFPQGKSPIPFVRDFCFPIDYDVIARGYVIL